MKNYKNNKNDNNNYKKIFTSCLQLFPNEYRTSILSYDNINLPNVFVLGATGVGKSSTCNTLS
jgi:predicted GTPase